MTVTTFAVEDSYLAEKILAIELGDAPAPSATMLAKGIVRAWEKLARHFGRLIGTDGILTLLDRSVILTRAKFAWLSSAPPAAGPERDPPWAWLREALVQQSREQAGAAFIALFSTLIRLLGRFIGDDLVARLLQEIWPQALPDEEKETP